mmetsp:Transcript_9434/g.26287  ORF Transcript_9434/g.26287 Transcript_9434/m.26287 type:complete len:307 (-) Transcript_9434:98-1018(-)
MKAFSRWVWVAPVSSALISSVASIVVMLWLRRLERRNTLRVRQLLSLSLADMVWSVGGVIYSSIPIVGACGWFGPNVGRAQVVCVATHVTMDVGFFVSGLLEVHIALSLVAKLLRRRALLNFLLWSLKGVWILWALGLALSVGETYSDHLYTSPSFDCRDGHADFFGACVVYVCFGTCVVAYGVSYFFLVCFGNITQVNRVNDRMGLFLLAWFVCIIPFVVSVPRGETESIVRIAAQTLIFFNGAANALVYVVLNGSLRRRRMVPTIPREVSHLRHTYMVTVDTARPLELWQANSEDEVEDIFFDP